MADVFQNSGALEFRPEWQARSERRCQHFNRQPSNAFYDPAAVSTLPTIEKTIPIFEARAGMNDPAATAAKPAIIA